jgi:hypothetical protein
MTQPLQRHRRWPITALLLLAGLPVAFALLTRRTPRPRSLSDGWQGCLVEPARLDSPTRGRVSVQPGDSAVLVLAATWGKSAFETGQSHGELLLTLPREQEAPAGVPLHFSGGEAPGIYREGKDGWVFESRELEGTVTITPRSDGEAELLVDLWAKSPILDLEAAGGVRLTGSVRAVRVTTARDCRRR